MCDSDSDNIKAGITIESTTKHIDPLYVIEIVVSYYIRLLLIVLKVLYSVRWSQHLKWSIKNYL